MFVHRNVRKNFANLIFLLFLIKLHNNFWVFFQVDYFTVCGICKKRLTRNHMYALGSEANELNIALRKDGIPVKLSDKLFLCKLCRYYSSLRLKYKDSSVLNASHKLFLRSYRKK